MTQTEQHTAETRAKLEAQLDRLRAELAVIEKSLDLKNRADISRPGFGKRVGDFTSEVIERTTREGSARNLRRMIAETETALQRVDEGNYGICNACGRPIPPERLEALPSATMCIECKKKEEATR
jgi:DnaK suppressor protein